jgi:predicted transcriptional regulator
MLTKEILREQTEKMPEQFSVDELFERLILVDKIQKGIHDCKNGNVFSEEEMETEFEKWFQE